MHHPEARKPRACPCWIGYVPVMASLRDQFQHYYVPDDVAIEEAIQTGMIVPDTNVLLSLYRFQSGARENLFQALEKVGDRLWIPHQVGHEFHERRLDVMREQESYFSATQAELDKLVDAVQGKIRNFRARIALSPESVKEIEDSIASLRDLVTDAVKKAEDANEVRLSGHSSDDILARVLDLFPDGRVGDPMEPKELEEARNEAERRAKEKIPPGYKDRGKTDPSGDYLVWRQLMMEATKHERPVILITDDRKEDWYWMYNGQTLGARRELREEMMAEAGVLVLIMTTETFLNHAETYLDIPLSPETRDQVTYQGWSELDELEEAMLSSDIDVAENAALEYLHKNRRPEDAAWLNEIRRAMAATGEAGRKNLLPILLMPPARPDGLRWEDVFGDEGKSASPSGALERSQSPVTEALLGEIARLTTDADEPSVADLKAAIEIMGNLLAKEPPSGTTVQRALEGLQRHGLAGWRGNQEGGGRNVER